MSQTRYEIAAKHPDGRAVVVAYTPRKSRPGILAAMRRRGPELVAALAVSDDHELTWTKGLDGWGANLGNGWRVAFTGRTQLDAVRDPLPPLCTAPAPDTKEDLVAELRALWNRQGVPVERQDQVLAEIETLARAGTLGGGPLPLPPELKP